MFVCVNTLARHIVRFYNTSKNRCVWILLGVSQTKFAYGMNHHMPFNRSIVQYNAISEQYFELMHTVFTWFVCGKPIKTNVVGLLFCLSCCSWSSFLFHSMKFIGSAIWMQFFLNWTHSTRTHTNGQICYYNLHHFTIKWMFLNWLRCLCVFLIQWFRVFDDIYTQANAMNW